MIKTDQENIQVLVRIRPLNSREKAEGAVPCMQVDKANPTTVAIDGKTYNYDYITGAETTQDDIFHIVGKPVALAWLEGYNACIFAYGQTGAGKTFTMQGKGLVEEGMDSPNRGLQPRVFDYVFGLINSLKKDNPENEYIISCNYLEIYNEQINDLLADNKHGENKSSQLSVREDLKKGVYVENLCEENAESSEDAINLLIKGSGARHVGATKMNADSSRSHSVFSLNFQSKVSTNGMIHVKNSKLHFVDLAGSERQKSTGAAGDRLKEASNINKSLTVLGQVINALVESANGKSRHIPYRDSKLTFILKDSLGGNSRTFMIAACSEANTQFQETLSTLKFAQRAKMIKNKASVNEESQGNVQQLKKEIQKLKEELQEAKKAVSDLEENQKNLTRIITPAKYTPTSMNHEAVIQFQQKNFKEINTKLQDVNSLLSDFNESRQRIEEYFLNEKLGVLTVFKDIVEQKKSGKDVDIIKALTQKSDMEEEGMCHILTEIDQAIIEDIQQMSQTKMKLEEFEERRKDFTSKLEKIGLMKFGDEDKEKELSEMILIKEKQINSLQDDIQHQVKLYKQQLEQETNQSTHLKEINQELKHEVELLQQQIHKNNSNHEERLVQFKNGYESKLAEYDESSCEIKIKNMELTDIIEEQKEQIDQLQQIKDEIKQRWEAAYENYQRALQLKNELENKNDELNEKLKIQCEENTTLRFQMNEQENQQNQDKLHLLTLEEEIHNKNQLIKEKEQLIENINNKAEEEKLHLLEVIDNEKNKINSLEDEIAKNKEDIETACQTLEYLNKQLEEKCVHTNQLQETYAEEYNKREKFENELKHLYHDEDSQLNIALKQNQLFNQQIKEIEIEITEKMEKINELEQDIHSINEKLTNTEKQLNSYMAQTTYLQNENETLNQSINEKIIQLQSTGDSLNEALEMCDQIENRLRLFEEENINLKNKNKDQEEQINIKDEQILQEQQKLRISQMTHELMKSQNDELKLQINEKSQQNNEFQDQLINLINEKKELIEKESKLIEENIIQNNNINQLNETITKNNETISNNINEIEYYKQFIEEQKKSAEHIQEIQNQELNQFKEIMKKLTEQTETQEFEIQNLQAQISQIQEDKECLKQEIKEKEELYLQLEKQKEDIIEQKNIKIDELIQERKLYEEEFDKMQAKYSSEIQNIAQLQQSLRAVQIDNESINKQIADNKEQMEQFQLEKAKFEEERQAVQQEMNSKDQIIKKFKEEYEQIGNKFEIFKNLNEQIEEQKNVYQQKFLNKSKDLDTFEHKYLALEQTLEKLNEKLTIKQLENNKLQNQLMIIQSNREKNQSVQEDFQRDLKKAREELSQVKEKYKSMILERQIQAQQQASKNSDQLSHESNLNMKKLEEENNKLKDQFNKYKQITEKKIIDISDKLNRGINAATIMKDIVNSTEITKRLEKQTEMINEKNIEILDLNNLVRTYLIECKKGQIDPAQREQYLEKIQNQDDLNALKEVFQSVLKNVEERERKVSHELFQLKEKKASHEYYKSKCEELEFKYEKKNPDTGEKYLNRKRKYSLKENEGPILGEIDINKKIKNKN